MDLWLVFIIVFFAIFTQSISGFGLALVSMPLLVPIVGIQTAAPLVAIIGLLAEAILLAYYRSAFRLRVVWRVALASIFGIPLGVWALSNVDEAIVLTALGVIVGGYALYALLNLRLPNISQPIWAYITGFLAGILGGAYNTAGPPVIIYGNARQWPPAEFKSNLQGFFLLNTAVIVSTHVAAANFTTDVWRSTLVALPAMAAGIVAGLLLSKRISASFFRKIVLWLLLILGVWLIVG